jgi:hypothetical protein
VHDIKNPIIYPEVAKINKVMSSLCNNVNISMFLKNPNMILKQHFLGVRSSIEIKWALMFLGIHD